MSNGIFSKFKNWMTEEDDYYEEDTLQKVKKGYDGYDYTIIYGLLRTVSKGREVMVYLKNPDFLERDMIAHPSCFVTRKVYEKYGLYSMEYPYSADYEFMLRIKEEKEIRFQGVYEILSNFSIDGASASVKGYRDTLRLKKRYGLISQKEYSLKMLKSWVAMKLGK